MKTRIKNWITSIIGVLLLVLGGFLLYKGVDSLYIFTAFGIGLGLLYAKDDLIKKLFTKI